MSLTLIIEFLKTFWPYILIAVIGFGAYHLYISIVNILDKRYKRKRNLV